MSAVAVVPALQAEDVKRHPFWLGGAAACMAVTITHPIDQTKIRSQVQPVRLSMIQTASNTIKTSGIRGLWAGWSGSILRQVTFGTARFGIYGALRETGEKGGREMGRWEMVRNGAIAGVVAGSLGSPGELVLVRMSADEVKPPQDRYNYRNAVQAIYRIVKDEGVSRIFKGAGATVLRGVILNGSQLSSYDIVKSSLIKSGYLHDGVATHLLTAGIAGTIAVTLCAPVDVIKSRIQSSAVPGDTAISILRRSLQQDGPRVLVRGWGPAWWRMMPNTMLTFAFLEQLRKVF